MYQKKKRIKDEKLLEEFRNKPCEVCGHHGPSDPHHIISRGAGGDDTRDNLISLCRSHHTQIHAIGSSTFFNKYPHVMMRRMLN